MLVVKVYMDNGVSGTTFQRDEFEKLMEDVANKKVDCIIVKDFARFGRDALDAVDLIDVIFPTLNVRFISVMDEYDSANPACAENRTTHILKHFVNDYYSREVSEKLVQAHKLSREKGEFWGSRPPYGYQRSKENSKKLVPEPEESKIVRQIFYWYVFEDMSSYDIAKELNAKEILGPEDSYKKREQGKETEKRLLWRSDSIRKLLQNPVYIGTAVFGKTKRMLAQNIPLQLIPRDQWELYENAWEYVATQVMAEYIRSLGYDGICFNSSVGNGRSYVFFCGPNMEYSSEEYGYLDKYLWDDYPKLIYFTDWFDIRKLEYNYVFPDGIKYQVESEKYYRKE